MKKRKEKFDIVTFELIRNGLSEIADADLRDALARLGAAIKQS